MAVAIPDLHAVERHATGKGAARQARRDGLVPGIVYGDDKPPLPVNFVYSQLLKQLRAGRFKSRLYNLKVEGHDDVRAICRDVQRHIVKDTPAHVDMMRLRRTTKINLFINVEFVNGELSPGLKRGGVLTVVRPEVELVVTAGDIPERITVNLEGLDIGDTVTISSVDLPSGSHPTIDRDFVIANISAPSGLRSADGDSESEEAGDVPEGQAQG